MRIADALLQVRDRIERAAAKSGRNPERVRLIAVSKTVGASSVSEAIHAGVTILGENRVQEAQRKIEEIGLIPESPVEWHLIGHLQKNKAKSAVRLFSLIHSVDSSDLARELNRHAENLSLMQDILIQVKLSDEETKQGISEGDLPGLVRDLKMMNSLNLKGLMTMPPYSDNPEEARPYFRRLRMIGEGLKQDGIRADELSMGMSHDLEVAVEEGATYVRVGTALFGERTYR